MSFTSRQRIRLVRPPPERPLPRKRKVTRSQFEYSHPYQHARVVDNLSRPYARPATSPRFPKMRGKPSMTGPENWVDAFVYLYYQ